MLVYFLPSLRSCETEPENFRLKLKEKMRGVRSRFGFIQRGEDNIKISMVFNQGENGHFFNRRLHDFGLILVSFFHVVLFSYHFLYFLDALNEIEIPRPHSLLTYNLFHFSWLISLFFILQPFTKNHEVFGPSGSCYLVNHLDSSNTSWRQI